MKKETITIKGAKIHNLRGVNLNIPKNKLIVVCGLSGSGKSSLAFDTIYAEGQRRYLESLSSYARQFLGGIKKPDVEKIEGLSPTIAINQKTISANPRSTVGTITEIYDYLRLLFARVGIPYCPSCHIPIQNQTPQEISQKIINLAKRYKEVLILAPIIFQKKGEFKGTINQIVQSGWPEIKIDGITYLASEAKSLTLDRNKKHTIEVVVDRILLKPFLEKISLVKSLSKLERQAIRKKNKKLKTIINEEKNRLLESVKRGLEIGKSSIIVEAKNNKKVEIFNFSTLFNCPKCGFSIPKIEPRLFSFNSPYGACLACQGLGKKMEVEESLLLNPELSIAQGAIFPLERLSRFGRRSFGVNSLKWQISEILENYGYDLNTPFKKISKEARSKILYGSGDFIGVISRLEKIYYTTESDFVRHEIAKYLVEKTCPVCKGARLSKEALSVKIFNKNIYDVSLMPIDKLIIFFEKDVIPHLSSQRKKIAQPIINEIINRAKFLQEVGLSYLNLARSANTLSVGENQRLRLAYQLGARLSGVVYVLDEPTIGLHQQDIDRLISVLKKLKELGNTIIVVEHDKKVIKSADWVIEIGPRAGNDGGKVVFEGSLKNFMKAKTITAKYLKNELKVSPIGLKSIEKTKLLQLFRANKFNLKNINLKIPLKKFVAICGVSGSGKSTLIIETLAKGLKKHLSHQKVIASGFSHLEGSEYLDKVILVDQSPIGKTPRSNPATYTNLFGPIRDVFTNLTESKIRGYKPGHFSFNTVLGRCESCRGEGYKKIEMYFLPDIYIKCETCHGTRYKQEILDVKFKNKNIAEVLEMTVKEAMGFFKDFESIKRRLKILNEIGLGYIKLGQPATTLSGGEAQRIKLAHELSKKQTGKTMYILDEPTVGLHFDDVKKLLLVLRKLQQKGNSIIIIEHNPDVIKEADWIIELGPGGGENGGEIIFEGTLEELKKAKTKTAKFIKQAN